MNHKLFAFVSLASRAARIWPENELCAGRARRVKERWAGARGVSTEAYPSGQRAREREMERQRVRE